MLFDGIMSKKSTCLLADPVGLYDPMTEHDACGVGMVVHLR